MRLDYCFNPWECAIHPSGFCCMRDSTKTTINVNRLLMLFSNTYDWDVGDAWLVVAAQLGCLSTSLGAIRKIMQEVAQDLDAGGSTQSNTHSPFQVSPSFILLSVIWGYPIQGPSNIEQCSFHASATAGMKNQSFDFLGMGNLGVMCSNSWLLGIQGEGIIPLLYAMWSAKI